MISVHEAEKLSLKGIAAFLHASEEIHFLGENRPQVYAWMETVLRQQQYVQQGRRARGLLRRYLEKMTGRSRAQVTRLIARYQAQGTVEAVSYRRHRFACRGPRRRRPAVRCRPACSAAQSGAADSSPLPPCPGLDSGQSSASLAPCGLAARTAVGATPSPSRHRPAAGFRQESGFLRWRGETPRSLSDSTSLLRAR